MSSKRTARRRGVMGLASAGAGVALLATALAAPAGADRGGSDYEQVRGNPSCAELGYDNEFTVTEPADGTYGDDDIEVTLTVTTSGRHSKVDVESSQPLDAVVITARSKSNIHEFETPQVEATGLKAPKKNIDEMTFCWNDGDEPAPTTTVPAEETEDEDGPETPAAPRVEGDPSLTG